MTDTKRDLMVTLPAALLAAAGTTTVWLNWVGTTVGCIMGSGRCRPSIPSYTIYIGAFAAVGSAFWLLQRRPHIGPIGYGTLFFIVTFVLSQSIGGALVYYFILYQKDYPMLQADAPRFSEAHRLIVTFKNLPLMTLLSLIFGVFITKAMCPAIALSAAVLATLLRGRRGPA